MAEHHHSAALAKGQALESPLPDEALQKLRQNIDRVDQEIIRCLAERAAYAQHVGEVKRDNFYRPEREAQVLRRLAAANPGPLPDAALQMIFREIMSACLALERKLKVAYLGPAGTFSESAAKRHFGSAPDYVVMPTTDEVFRAVETGHVDYCVVPVENSTEGVVGGTLDLLLRTPAHICGEVMLRIHHHLLSTTDDLGAVKRLYSHAQSLAQCRTWLNAKLSNLARIPVASNGEAAKMAAQDEQSCAIAGEAAALLYGLNVLAFNIEDEPNNTTRFLVIGQYAAKASGRDKTSLICAAPNRAGTMYELLEPFARNGVSMTKLQSRPARDGLWDYVFYIDIEGHSQDAVVAKALAELSQRAAFVKVLGSYPAAPILA